MNPRFLPAFVAACAIGIMGCNDVSWPSERNVTTLRILGVKAEPASLMPGQSTSLSLLCADGIHGGQSDPTCNFDPSDPKSGPIEVAWFGGCNNPPNNDPLKCLNAIDAASSGLSPTLSDTPATAQFAVAPNFEFTAPSEILQGEVTLAGQAIHYGVSYVFFIACAGRLQRIDGVTDRLPAECRDPSTNGLLDPSRAVTGYTTIYTYSSFENTNPFPSNVRFGDVAGNGVPVDSAPAISCSSDADCNEQKPGQHLWACRLRDSRCLPVTSPCDTSNPQSCQPSCIDFQLPIQSFLLTVNGNAIKDPKKSLWAENYTNAGHVPDDARFGLTPPEGNEMTVTSPCAYWQAPPFATDEARIWIVVRDDRGGIGWLEQQILVR